MDATIPDPTQTPDSNPPASNAQPSDAGGQNFLPWTNAPLNTTTPEPASAEPAPVTLPDAVTTPPLDPNHPLVATAVELTQTPPTETPITQVSEPIPSEPVKDWNNFAGNWAGETPSDDTPIEVPLEVTQTEGVTQPAEVAPAEVATIDPGVVAPEEAKVRSRSKIFHIALSLLIILVVVTGAALASYLYVKKGSTFIKLPKLPFIKEPQTSVEIAPSQESPEPSTPIEVPVENPEIGPELTPVPVTDAVTIPSSWQTFKSSSWGYSIQYPPDWYLYPRDTGAIGEATMFAAEPLGSLDDDLKTLQISPMEMVVGSGVLARLEGQTISNFLSKNASQYQISAPVAKIINGKTFYQALTIDGSVQYFFTTDPSNTLVYFVGLKPAKYDNRYADIIPSIVASFIATGQ